MVAASSRMLAMALGSLLTYAENRAIRRCTHLGPGYYLRNEFARRLDGHWIPQLCAGYRIVSPHRGCLQRRLTSSGTSALPIARFSLQAMDNRSQPTWGMGKVSRIRQPRYAKVLEMPFSGLVSKRS